MDSAAPTSAAIEQFSVTDRDPLFFMHITKTAGMSMRLYLDMQYLERDICPAASWQDIARLDAELRSYRLVHGHFQYNVRSLVADNARTLVVLRDPLRRTVSALRHMQRDPAFHPDHHIAKDLTLAQALRHEQLMENQRNVQSRFLCASALPSKVFELLADDSDADPASLEDPPELALAQERLRAIDFVGLTEDLDGLVEMMASEMHYHPPLYFPFVNENPNRADPLGDLTDEDLALLRECNDIDLQVYDYASSLIRRRRLERQMRALVASGTYHIPPGSFAIDFGAIVPGSGWYEIEHEDGRAWRWSGPGRYCTIVLPLRADATYRVRFNFSSARPLEPGGIAVDVNDTPLKLTIAPDGPDYSGEFVIPQELLAEAAGCCRIRFDTRETRRVDGDDLRPLGIAVGRVEFECLES